MKIWSGAIINVVGVGAATHLQLAGDVVRVLERADVIFGAAHQFEKLGPIQNISAQRIDYPSPIDTLADVLRRYVDKNIVMLASGDALYFGIGAWLVKHIGVQHCRFFCNVSSVQAAFALLGKPWQSAEVISLHGRPLHGLRSRIRRNRSYAILTDADNTPLVIARELLALGFEHATLWVVEAINDPAQRIRQFTPLQIVEQTPEFHPLNVCILESGNCSGMCSDFPGLADELFADPDSNSTYGMFTKREVRVAILTLLQPTAGEVGWDVGAGFGSVSIEWARWQPQVQIHAVEGHPARFDILSNNINRFGVVDMVQPIKGHAPGVLNQLPTPDVVFLGGSQGGIENLVDNCWQRLRERGRLVVSAVTEITKASLIKHVHDNYAADYPVEWTEIAVSKGASLAGQLLLQPRLPVLLLYMQKSPRDSGSPVND